MSIEVIEKQEYSWHLQFNGNTLFFSVKPIALYFENELMPITPNADNGLRWRIKGKWISYNQIKKTILCYQKM